MLSSLGRLRFSHYEVISPSQVRYRAALRPDLPKRLEPIMISGFEAQGATTEKKNKRGKNGASGNFGRRDSHGKRHGCSIGVPADGDLVVFAFGPSDQEPRVKSYNDIRE